MSHAYHLYGYVEGGLKKNYSHWHTLKPELIHFCIVTDDPSKVSCPGCLEYLKRPRN